MCLRHAGCQVVQNAVALIPEQCFVQKLRFVPLNKIPTSSQLVIPTGPTGGMHMLVQ